MTDFEIFKSCFPEYRLTEALFNELIEKDNCSIFREEGAVAYINGKKLALLAVAPEFRNNGAGTRLLKRCEEHIKSEGYDGAYLCGFFPGLPIDSREFFIKHGYETLGNFVEMGMDIADFRARVCSVSDDVSFGFFKGSHDDLLRAVAEVEEEWVQYFTNDETVFCGFRNGELASFCIVDENVSCLLSDGKAKVGSIGCVGTRPRFRSQGIGLCMVECATELLVQRGCDKSFIHYTHLEDWYGKLGYRAFLRFCASRKLL